MFNGKFYSWWKTQIHDFIIEGDSEFWDVIYVGPYILIESTKERYTTPSVPKDRKDYTEVDQKRINKNYKVKKILIYGIKPAEYNQISSCESAKVIWKSLQNSHKGTIKLK